MTAESAPTIAHAWTTVCDSSALAADSDNLRLDTLEAIYIDKSDDDEPVFVQCRLEVVSLWYRRDASRGGRARAHVCVLGPDLAPLAHAPIDVDLTRTARARTCCVIDGLLIQQLGTYFIAIDLLEGDPAREVARVPLQIERSERP
jgi:hypothetical protein